ncbi:hypothetical protein [Paenibacillus sp. A14]|uniref:hypothetical protein n=1 Tax=Paenibacillus sp. A14 TaxID=3119820 RepID=UPI002FDF6616
MRSRGNRQGGQSRAGRPDEAPDGRICCTGFAGGGDDARGGGAANAGSGTAARGAEMMRGERR